MTDADDRAGDEPIRITVIIQQRLTLDAPAVTGRQIREKAGIPADFSLHRRMQGATESIRDDCQIAVHTGDHFYAQPQTQRVLGHDEER